MNRNALNGKSLRFSNTLRALETKKSVRGTVATRMALPTALLCSSLAFLAPSAHAQGSSAKLADLAPTEKIGRAHV